MKKRAVCGIIVFLVYLLCGCAGEDKYQNYFEFVSKIAKEKGNLGNVREFTCDIILTGGGREADGVFTYYINEDDAYYHFDLSEQLTETEQVNWEAAAAFRREEKNTTCVCWRAISLDGTKTPNLAVVEFVTDNPQMYTTNLYTIQGNGVVTDINCYGFNNLVYVMWCDSGQDRLSVIEHNKRELRDLSIETELLEEYAKEKLSAIYIGNYCVLSEVDNVIVYGAEVREASDMPVTEIVLMAIKDGVPVDYMSIDLMAKE